MWRNGNRNSDKLFDKMEYAGKYRPYAVNVLSLCHILVRSLFFLLVFGWAQTGWGQTYTITLRGKDADLFKQASGLPSQVRDSTAAREALQSATANLFSLGYVGVSVDTMVFLSKGVDVTVHLGNSYRWVQVRAGNVPPELLHQSRLQERQWLNKPLEPKLFYSAFERMLRVCEDNGYPFASVRLDSLREEKGKVSAAFDLRRGPYITLDSVVVGDDPGVARYVVLRYLGLREGMPYNETKIAQLSTRLRELPYMEEVYPWRMDFTQTRNTLNLYVKTKSANRADVLLGVMPNNEEIGGRFLMSGDVKIGLLNALGLGENVQLNWQNLQYRSPRYHVDMAFPFLFNSPIGLSGKFDFYKKDTVFRTTTGELGFLYQPDAFNYVKFYYNLSSSRSGSINVAQLQSTRRLPANGDVRYRTVGIEALWSKLDYRNNPRKGYRLLANGGVSFRTMLKNNVVETTPDPVKGGTFAWLYDSLALRSNKYTITLLAQGFVPLSKKWVLHTAYAGGLTFSNNRLFRNELYQIGGYRLLRGFDEGSLFVDAYHVFTVEPRFMLSLNNYFFMFTDFGRMHLRFNQDDVLQHPFSAGLGLSFENKAGQFTLSYAVGGREQAPWQVRNSKIHFGYVNYF